ncbi:Serine/threonine-protein kinase rio2 [Saitoella coloradoensis]
MKLNTHAMRYLTNEDFRVLTAVEMGSKNHEVVPTPLIIQIAGLRGGAGVARMISTLAKTNLIAKVPNTKYDGYRLTYGGYDYLAMKAFSKKGAIYSTGNQIGVGKESDVYVVASETGEQRILKLHRLGRISFRTIKQNRDYMQNRKSASWMYMSRLSAEKEYAFMKILYENNFPVPKPIEQNRHCIVMELIDAFPLRGIEVVEDPEKLYSDLMALIVRLGRAGLIHGDYNEFNILVYPSGQPILIDFPQMLSIDHQNAEEYFDRDVDCIITFFERKFGYVGGERPDFEKDVREKRSGDLDVQVAASGFTKKKWRELDAYRAEFLSDSDSEDDSEEESGSEEEEEESAQESEEEDENEEKSAEHDSDFEDDLNASELDFKKATVS